MTTTIKSTVSTSGLFSSTSVQHAHDALIQKICTLIDKSRPHSNLELHTNAKWIESRGLGTRKWVLLDKKNGKDSIAPYVELTISGIARAEGFLLDQDFSEEVKQAKLAWENAHGVGEKSKVGAQFFKTLLDRVFAYNEIISDALDARCHSNNVERQKIDLNSYHLDLSSLEGCAEFSKLVEEFALGFITVFGFFETCASLYGLKEELRLIHAFETTSEAEFASMCVDAKDVLAKMRPLPGFKKALEDKALKTFGGEDARAQLEQYCQEAQFVGSIRSFYIESLHLQPDRVQDLSLLELIGLCFEVYEKKAEWSRLLGPTHLEKIQKLHDRGFAARIAPSAPITIRQTAQKERTAFVSRAHHKMLLDVAICLAKILMGLAWLAIGIVGFLPLVGIAAATPLWLTITVMVSIAVYNALEIVNKLKTDGFTTQKDKRARRILVTLYALAFVINMVFGLVFHWPSAELIAASLLLSFSLFFHISFVGVSNWKDKQWNFAHPSLEKVQNDFKTYLDSRGQQDGPVTADLMDSFKKLSKEDRKAVRAVYKKTPLVMKKANFGWTENELIRLITTQNSSIASKDMLELYQRALKKAVHRCWEQSDGSADKEMRALHMETLLLAAKNVDEQATRAAWKLVHDDAVSCNILNEEFNYVLKRQVSCNGLKKALDRVQLQGEMAYLVANVGRIAGFPQTA